MVPTKCFEVTEFDHIKRNALLLVRSPDLMQFERAQYWDGRPPVTVWN